MLPCGTPIFTFLHLLNFPHRQLEPVCHNDRRQAIASNLSEDWNNRSSSAADDDLRHQMPYLDRHRGGRSGRLALRLETPDNVGCQGE